MFWSLLIGISTYEIYEKVTDLKIDEYVVYLMQTSTIYEENYINPKTVNITFPDNKRNLIFIYLESMETTYLDKENGGGIKENVIPELYNLAKNNTNF